MVPGGPSTSKPAWSNAAGIPHVGFFVGRRATRPPRPGRSGRNQARSAFASASGGASPEKGCPSSPCGEQPLDPSKEGFDCPRCVLLGFFLVVVTAVLRSRRRKVVTGREGLIGATGVVRRDVEPGRTGIVLVQGELWKAVAPEGRLSQGERVVVQSLEGLLLSVRRAVDVVPAPPRPAAPAIAKSNTARA